MIFDSISIFASNLPI